MDRKRVAIDKISALGTNLELRRKEEAIEFLESGILKYVFLPHVARGGPLRQELYLMDNDPELIHDQKLLKSLLKEELYGFVSACKKSVSSINKLRDEAHKNNQTFSIIVPKMGALLLYLTFKEFLGVNWDDEVVLVNYASTGKDRSVKRKNMQKAFKKELDEAFNSKHGKTIVILDEVVSGSSVNSILGDLIETMDKGMGIIDEKEEDHYMQFIRDTFSQYIDFKRKFLKKGLHMREDYGHFFSQLCEFLRDPKLLKKTYLLRKEKNPEEKAREYFFDLYFPEIENLLIIFKKEMRPYLNREESMTYGVLEKKIREHIADVSAVYDTDKKKAYKVLVSLKRLVHEIIHIESGSSFLQIALERRFWQEWLEAFNVNVVFVTVQDRHKEAQDLLRVKEFYKSMVLRHKAHLFKTSRIVTQDILSGDTRKLINSVKGIPSWGSMQELREVFSLLEGYFSKD